MTDRITRIVLPEVYPTPEYAHAVIVEPGRLALFSGVCPLDGDGHVVAPGDLSRQVDQVVANALAVLANVGAKPDDVVRTVIYVVSTDRAELSEVWEALLKSGLAPALRAAATLLGVTTLGYAGQRLEVDLTAVLS
jgi:enamine deaminase RidA (YjgF/YER057c/UK114 family)